MLATVEIIKEVIPHPGADRLDLVKVLGFQCVTQKGLHEAGNKIVYVRPDTILPELEWSEGYRKYAPGRVKAVMLRKEWSEGIIVTFEQLEGVLDTTVAKYLEPGFDVATLIGVTKYEPPTPVEPGAIGYLPYNIPETSQERWENIMDKLPIGEKVDVTLKVDGRSMSTSVFFKDKSDIDNVDYHVCGRRLSFDLNSDVSYVRAAKSQDLMGNLMRYIYEYEQPNLMIRGELLEKFQMFSVFNIDKNEYAHKGTPLYFLEIADQLGVEIVPVIEKDVVLTQELINHYSFGIKRLNGQKFEGVVVNHANGSFKIINKYYDAEK